MLQELESRAYWLLAEVLDYHAAGFSEARQGLFAAHLSTQHSEHAQQQGHDGSMVVQRVWNTGEVQAAEEPQLFIPV